MRPLNNLEIFCRRNAVFLLQEIFETNLLSLSREVSKTSTGNFKYERTFWCKTGRVLYEFSDPSLAHEFGQPIKSIS